MRYNIQQRRIFMEHDFGDYSLGSNMDDIRYHFLDEKEGILVNILAIPLGFVLGIDSLINDIFRARNRGAA